MKVSIPLSIPEREISLVGRDILRKWWVAQARRVISERVEKFAREYGFQVAKITIKDTVSRWGSCSRKGNLNFNWRLILAPMHIIDYLVVHEISHLGEMNHSPKFWALVARKCPDYKNHVAWLKSCGRQLFAF